MVPLYPSQPVRPLTSLYLPVLPDALRTPRAAGPIFEWCVTSASFELEPRIIKAQFGDGYAQRRPAGINTQMHKWTVEMKNLDGRTYDAVLAFLEARNGVEVFNWTPPRTTTAQSVICPSWSGSYGDMVATGGRLRNVQMKFEQVFE
jgi:phage-related protein